MEHDKHEHVGVAPSFAKMINPGPFRGVSDVVATVLTQLVMITAAFALYFVVRDLTKNQTADAFANAEAIFEFERSLGIAWEKAAQDTILNYDFLVTFFNWVYMYFHWPVLAFAAVFTFIGARPHYITYRNAMIVSGLIGLAFFALSPVAPPRLADPSSFFDSLAVLSKSFEVLQPQGLVNRYAALPSFHVGWNMLAGAALWHGAQHRAIRAFGVISPALMTLAVVVTANHWVVDVLAGLVIAGAALLIAHRLEARRLRRFAPPASAGS